MDKYLFCSFAFLFLSFSPKCAGGEIIADHVCPKGWDNHLTRCYWYLDVKKLTWQKANEDCQDLGGYLYVPSNDDEGIFVQEALEKRESFASISEAIWIGCDDQKEEGTYVCHEDTGDTGYRNWAYKEPSDSWNFVWGEDCLSAYTGRPNNSVVPLWNDKACNNVEYHAVCERSGTSLYTITRRFQMPSQITGRTARVIPNYCLVELPDLQPKGVQTSSLIRCAVSCADDSQCAAFNFKRPLKKTEALNSTTYKLKGTCQKLTFTTNSIKTGFLMTPIDGCNYYELECRK